MEIERKFTIKELPENLSQYPCLHIEQGYLNTDPVLRIRKQNDDYILTYKGKGMLAREEYNLPLNEAAYANLKTKCDGNIISKKRYLIPYDKFTIELDVFDPPFAPLVMAEIEFDSIEAANAFLAPDWFLEDVTHNANYHNSTMSRMKF